MRRREGKLRINSTRFDSESNPNRIETRSNQMEFLVSLSFGFCLEFLDYNLILKFLSLSKQNKFIKQ